MHRLRSRLAGPLALALLFAPVRDARAFDADVHYLWTWYLALHAGYSERQAWQIASAAQAVEQDPDTTPLLATAWDTWRAREAPPGSPVARAWRDFHCFADRGLAAKPPPEEVEQAVLMIDLSADAVIEQGSEVPQSPNAGLVELGWVAFPDGPAKAARFDRNDALWTTALAGGNPGPLLYFEQECWAHRDFTDARGHAFAGHAPDWSSADRERALGMTRSTLDLLAGFAEQHLSERPPPPDMDRIAEVLDQLLEANPLDTTGLVRPQGAYNPYTEWWPEHLGGLGADEAAEQWEALAGSFAQTYATGRPSFDEAVAVLAAATSEDKFYGRLQGLPEEWWAPPPAAWRPYDLDPVRVAADDPAWAIEQPAVAIVPARIGSAEPDGVDALYRVEVTVAYTISGLADLPRLGGVPVWEACTVRDADGSWVRRVNRDNGNHGVHLVLARHAGVLVRGLSGECTVRVQGLDPVTVAFEVPPVEDRAAPPRARSDALQPFADKLAALRHDARTLAGDAATACLAAGLGKQVLAGFEARADAVGEDLDRLEQGLAALDTTPAQVAASVPTAADADARWAALDAAVAAMCERADRLEASLDLAEVRALQPRPADHRALDEALRGVSEAVKASGAELQAAGERPATLSALGALGRRLQDAAWALDGEVRAADRSLVDARKALAAAGPALEGLSAVNEQARTTLDEARVVYGGLGGTGAEKKAWSLLQSLRDDVSAVHERHGACAVEAGAALDAHGKRVVALGDRAADLASRQAAAASALPGWRALMELQSRVVAVQLVHDQATERLADADARFAQGSSCYGRAETAFARKTSP